MGCAAYKLCSHSSSYSQTNQMMDCFGNIRNQFGPNVAKQETSKSVPLIPYGHRVHANLQWRQMAQDFGMHANSRVEVLAVGDPETFCRLCVDCGLYIGRFCDFCLAADRIPTETWAAGQHTPFCSQCDGKEGSCHYCRGVKWAAAPGWGPRS